MAGANVLPSQPLQPAAGKTRGQQSSRHLSVEQIVAWAEAHHEQTGQWPTDQSGPVLGTQGELWPCIDMALWLGERGLPAGTSLEELLAERAGQPDHLTVEQILAWVDSYHARTGRWPKPGSPRVDGQPRMTWAAVDRALRHGEHGLHGRSSLTLLLRNYRGVTDQRKRSPLTIEQILAWADAHHQLTGKWPQLKSGPVIEGNGSTTWQAIDAALCCGGRGLPGGSTLRKLLAEHRDVRHSGYKPSLTVEQILDWADAYRARTGQWPSNGSGDVDAGDELTWGAINGALRVGCRSLPGGSSLAKLLVEHRDHDRRAHRPPLSVEQILAWADAHHAETGTWPGQDSGPINGSSGETWVSVDSALRNGNRGLPGDSSVAKLLREHRGAGNARQYTPLGIEQILSWADAHRKRSGQWPNIESGEVANADGTTWRAIYWALKKGHRSLPGGLSLRLLLEEHRGLPTRKKPLLLTVKKILAWADAHHEATGRWPTSGSGRVVAGDGSTWGAIDRALRDGTRGLTGGTTLRNLLVEHRGAPALKVSAPLTESQILGWADDQHRRTGKWPTTDSGPILDAPEDTWHSIGYALRRGHRGLPGGSSLARLLREQRHGGKRSDAPPLDIQQILAWADAHRNRTGKWPHQKSGPVAGANGLAWSAIDAALRKGCRGLPGGSSLAKLLCEHRGKKRGRDLPPLDTQQILAWAKAHRKRTGKWPTGQTGPVVGGDGLTWRAIESALRKGNRGLPGGSSLSQFLKEHQPTKAK